MLQIDNEWIVSFVCLMKISVVLFVRALLTRNSAIAGRPRDAKAGQRLLNGRGNDNLG